MKELSVEQKAKAYDEAVKVAENIHRFSSDPAEIKRMEEIFPELEEGKDERIRKEIIEQINLLKSATLSDLKVNQFNSWIAWLEKQGEHAIFFNKIQIGDKVTRNRDGVLVNLSQLNRVAKPAERQGENSMSISEATKQKLKENLNKALEKETPESWNEFLEKQGTPNQTSIWKHWKDGIAGGAEGEQIFLIKIGRVYTISSCLGCECDYILLSDLDKLMLQEKQGEQKPAWSEEQREKEPLSDIENSILNFAMQFHDNRMKPEAEWEDELKMLRDNIKIDPWSEQEQVRINRIVACLENLNVADNDILLKDVDWLNSIKDRVQPQPKWSEKDETGLGDALWCCKQAASIAKDENDMGNVWYAENWLKSLKDRYTWKPSDEHYELEEFAKIVRGNLTGISKTVQELFKAKYLQLTGNKMYRGFKD